MTIPALVGAVSVGRGGQLRFALPGVARVPHPTGVQGPCVTCAVKGRDRQGVPRYAGDSRLLCKSCWTAEERKRYKADRDAFFFDLWAGIGAAEEAARCAACGEAEPSPACWLCAYSWLAEARAEYERQLAVEAEQAAAEEAARVAQVEAEFARIAATTRAEARVRRLEAWIARCRRALDGYAAGSGTGRPVELLAELLARVMAGRTSLRGRPSALPGIAWVQALDADYRSGRRSMPGRDWTAELADCTPRTVTAGWRVGQDCGWSTRIRIGGPLPLEDRAAKGRVRDAAEFDLVPLHKCDPQARAPWIPVAVEVAKTVLARALELLEQAQQAWDDERARWGDTSVDWAERVRRLQLRQAVTAALDADLSAPNTFPPHGVCTGEYFSSWPLMGTSYSPSRSITPPDGDGLRADGPGEQIGASRSPTEGADRWCGSQPVGHPRTVQGGRRRSRRRARPDWVSWAYRLATELAALWPAAARPERGPWLVPGVLGAHLGPDWTARMLVDYLFRRRRMPLLDEPARPGRHLRVAIREAMEGDLELPAAARWEAGARAAAAEAARAQVVQHAAAAATEHDRLRAEWDDRDARAAKSTGAGRAAARAELARITARRAAQAEPRPTPEPWPAVPQPGSGAPTR